MVSPAKALVSQGLPASNSCGTGRSEKAGGSCEADAIVVPLKSNLKLR